MVGSCLGGKRIRWFGQETRPRESQLLSWSMMPCLMFSQVKMTSLVEQGLMEEKSPSKNCPLRLVSPKKQESQLWKHEKKRLARILKMCLMWKRWGDSLTLIYSLSLFLGVWTFVLNVITWFLLTFIVMSLTLLHYTLQHHHCDSISISSLF